MFILFNFKIQLELRSSVLCKKQIFLVQSSGTCTVERDGSLISNFETRETNKAFLHFDVKTGKNFRAEYSELRCIFSDSRAESQRNIVADV